MESKDFQILIKGTFCSVPHSERQIMIYCDELSMEEVLIVAYNSCTKIKNKLRKAMKPSELKELQKRFDRFHFAEQNDNAPTKECYINIFGKYNSSPDSDRKIIIDGTKCTLTDGEITLVLFEACCIIRNKLAETKSRDELHELANVHKLENLGMLKSEKQFETR